MKRLLPTLSFALFGLASAWQTSLANDAVQAPAAETAAAPIPVKNAGTNNTMLYCPDTASLKKNEEKEIWYSEDHQFKSYGKSFATELTDFLGAQWTGASVGQVICLYKGKPKSTFYIMLIFGTLTYQPSAGKWGSLEGNYINCRSSDPQDCGFKMRLEKKEGDIFKDADKLREPLTGDSSVDPM